MRLPNEMPELMDAMIRETKNTCELLIINFKNKAKSKIGHLRNVEGDSYNGEYGADESDAIRDEESL